MGTEPVSYNSYVDADGMIHFGRPDLSETLCGTSKEGMDHWRKFFHLGPNVCPFCQHKYHARERKEVSNKSGD